MPHHQPTMPPISLLTDFGLRDSYVGQMKAVIAQIAPQAQLIDLTHHIHPQDVLAGAVMLADAIAAFDMHAIHLAVVDPGVGTDRRAIAIACEKGTFVGPDNGLFSLILAESNDVRAVVLDNPAYHRQAISCTFHGRDIFACVAGHLACGVDIESLGTSLDPSTLCRIKLPRPTLHADEIGAQVLLADHFGNLLTNLSQADFERWRTSLADVPEHYHVTIEQPNITMPLAQTYAQVDLHEPVAYFGSSGRLELAVRDGSAQKQWNTQRFEDVRIMYK